MPYPKRAITPPPVFAAVVGTDGNAITSGVTAKYNYNLTQTDGAGSLSHLGNGDWAYYPTPEEANVNSFSIKFYHASAVGSGPTISIITDELSIRKRYDSMRNPF